MKTREPVLLLLLLLVSCAVSPSLTSSNETEEEEHTFVPKPQPYSCTEIISDGDLSTQNKWVDCSFGVQQLNSTFDGKQTVFVALMPGGVLSLCTQQPFGKIFDDVGLQMWLYTSENFIQNVQLELVYSQKADGIAYTTGTDQEYDERFSKYTVEEANDMESSIIRKVSSLKDPWSSKGNWTRITTDLESSQEDSSSGHNFPIYNRISIRNVNRNEPVALVIDSLVLVKNYTESKLFVTSASEATCRSPEARLPPANELDETFRSMLEVSEVERQNAAIPLFAGISCALFVVAILVVSVSIVLYRQNIRHLYIPFEDLKFDDPPEVIGRGKFGYVLRAYYGGFPVATKLVLPSDNYKGNVFESALDTSSLDSVVPKGTVEYIGGAGRGGKDPDPEESLVEFMYTYGHETNPSPTSLTDSQMRLYHVDSSDSTISASSAASSRSLLPKSWRLRKDFENEIRMLMKLRHPNIVTIMGVSKDPVAHDYVLVMERMSRGSLIDCLTNPTVNLEPELLMSIIKDVVSGMAYLHNLKPAVTHNDLRAANVLIDDNFTAKISDFGVSGRQKFISTTSKWPWTAPEILSGSCQSTQTDVYSFGVLLIEIYSICRLTVSDMRLVIPDKTPPFAQALIRDCLNLNPSKRPSFKEIQERIAAKQRALTKSSSIIPTRNLMCARLPANIAEDIKLGRSPSSTSYKCLTLFMSDIVGYTELTAKCGPEVVTTMLNCFYNKLDKLVTKHGLYKIETIGDAYIAVGGIIENSDQDHCARIIDFSEDALAAAKETSISPSSGDMSSIDIRIGVHTGPCVGAVVGQLNPKFSLYGDTVNVVSRIESTGKSGVIHLSADAAELLRKQKPKMARHYLHLRGQTELKGKGFMTTYWYTRKEPPACAPAAPAHFDTIYEN